MEWQPIETAPKAGTEILAMHNRALGGMRWTEPYIVSWRVAKARLDGYVAHKGEPWWVAYDEIHLAPRPTHWMPLPPPPIEDQP